MWRMRALAILLGLLLVTGLGTTQSWAQEGDAAVVGAAAEAKPEAAEATPPVKEPTAAEVKAEMKVAMDTVWVIIAGMLVFFMNLGFGCVESGMCRSKNCVNILSKNFIVFAVSTLAYWMLGWGLMFGNDSDGKSDGGFYGKSGLFFASGKDNSPEITAYSGDYQAIAWAGIPFQAKFFFQLVFAGTAATIVSGAVAERIKYHTFIVFSFILGTVIYPVVGHWIWGGGWLQARGFVDFAGSTQVHSIGGWAALAGILILGPRIGKYSPEGKVNAIPGHSLPLATIGCFVLWFGWFGFNPGSTMAVDPVAIADICVTTNTAAAIATITATITAWVLLGKPDLGMTLNGSLAGLVAITAPCAFVTVPVSAAIGAVAGVAVVLAVLAFDRAKIDDPVGATSVHLVNGVFGTICVGLFSHPDLIARSANPNHKAGLFYTGDASQVITQLIGIGATAGFVLVTTLIVWVVLNGVMGLRVKKEEEIEGLDHGEHGNVAYPDFVAHAPTY